MVCCAGFSAGFSRLSDLRCAMLFLLRDQFIERFGEAMVRVRRLAMTIKDHTHIAICDTHFITQQFVGNFMDVHQTNQIPRPFFRQLFSTPFAVVVEKFKPMCYLISTTKQEIEV